MTTEVRMAGEEGRKVEKEGEGRKEGRLRKEGIRKDRQGRKKGR